MRKGRTWPVGESGGAQPARNSGVRAQQGGCSPRPRGVKCYAAQYQTLGAWKDDGHKKNCDGSWHELLFWHAARPGMAAASGAAPLQHRGAARGLLLLPPAHALRALVLNKK